MADDFRTVSLNLTTGVIFIGLIVTGFLYGVTTSQAVWYYAHYSKDRTFLKYMVAIVCALDTLSLVFYIATEWETLVVQNPVTTTALMWTSNAQTVCNAASIAIIQSFYAFRIWTLSRSKILVGCLGAFVAADLALGLALFAHAVEASNLNALPQLVPYSIALSSITTVTDVFLTVSLVVLLIMSRTGISGSNRLINRLLVYTINTGLLTSICTIMSLITVLAFPHGTLYVMFYYIGSRMYTVSLLATLNAREGLRCSAEQQFTLQSTPWFTARASAIGTSTDDDWQKRSALHTPHEILVSVHRDTTVMFDEDFYVPKVPPRRNYRSHESTTNAETAAADMTILDDTV